MIEIPVYFVSTGISGGTSEPTYATYVRRASGSLRRIHSRDYRGREQLPERLTRLQALEDLNSWLGSKMVRSTPGTGYGEYQRQAHRVYDEIQVERGRLTGRA
jgi:hypothetical protein